MAFYRCWKWVWMMTILLLLALSVAVCEGCLNVEREALLKIKDDINYPNGSSLSDWKGHDCCQWSRVTCNDSTGRVTELELVAVRREELGTWYPNASLFAQLEELSGLDLVDNQIGGWRMPQGICELTSLQLLDLSDNRLDEIPMCLSNLTKLQDLRIAGNGIRGNFLSSSGLCKLVALEVLYLSENKFDDHKLPTCLGNLTELEWLLLSGNNLSGNLSPGICELTTLQFLDLSGNRLDEIPMCLSNLTKLQYLNIAGNGIRGNSFFSSGLYELRALEYISLSNNHLHFDTTPSFFNMTRLEVLLLDKNAFNETKIFQGLANISSLKVLDMRENFLTGTLPTWLSTLSNLTSLLLGGNKFDGHIFAELCQMQRLRLLDFSYNNLSGDIPRCFNNISAWINHGASDPMKPQSFMRYNLRTTFTTKGRKLTYEGTPLVLMTGVDFSSNRMTGKIPLEIGYLKEIRSLNLSHNLFTGNIPKTFQHLQNIESLDLSNNKLTGHIPMELTQLYFLSVFNVAFNNLSGMIPYFSKGQFSTFNESIYEGNPGLCGQPLKRNCSPSPPVKPSVEQSKENDESTIADNPLFFYSCVAISYALGFWSFIAFLYICKSWRMKLFSVVDRYFKN